MKKDTRITAVITAILGSCLLFSCRTTAGLGNSAYTMKTVSAKTAYLTAGLSYPQYAGLPEFNAAIEKTVLDGYHAYTPSAEQNWKAIDDIRRETGAEEQTPPLEYDVSCSPIIANSRYASVLILTYVFEGGAHGNTVLRSFTWDKQKSKIVSISEVTGYTAAQLSQLCCESLKKTLNPADVKWIEEGTPADLKRYSSFTYDGKTLIIYFQAYEVAPYSSGIPEVRLLIRDKS